jgi:hypothetical protein
VKASRIVMAKRTGAMDSVRTFSTLVIFAGGS